MERRRRLAWLMGVLLGLGSVDAKAAEPQHRLIVSLKAGADLASVRAALVRTGATVVREVPEIGMLVIVTAGTTTPTDAASAVAGAAEFAEDTIVSLAPPDGTWQPQREAPGLRSARTVDAPAATAKREAAIRPDPAFGYEGLLWDYERIGLPSGWKPSTGNPDVTVGVADTGIDFTHAELRSAVVQVKDFTADDRPSACRAFFGGPTDRELAARFGGPVTTDWNGHGSWIAGNIAARLDGRGINGIAPKVRLVALKIAENCGSTYNSNLIDSFVWAGRNGIDIVSISFGGYVDRSLRGGEVIYREFTEAVAFARSRGTVIVASAGNEHVRIGKDGLVLSHGRLTTPGASVFDLFGFHQVPGGVPGVVDVASSNNRTIPASARCLPGTTGSRDDNGATAVCKPRSDRHQATGQGLQDQLAYYSNYGPRIDVAAPGGSRKFNLPAGDRGGTPGFPYVTADATQVWADFGVTSNFSTEIPCFVFAKGSGFPEAQCYTAIQGTSMAAPHASAILALLASAEPALRGKPEALVARLKAGARKAHNLTPPLSASDRSRGDLIRLPCDDGYCHLGGPAIKDAEAYGAGIVQIR